MTEKRCLICKQTRIQSHRAILAPWIRDLCELTQNVETYFQECENCGFASFSYRYTESDMKSIYEHYRGPQYISARRSWEPWYTVRDADYYKFNDAAVRNRNDFMRNAFDQAKVSLDSIKSVLDFGGDLGQFIPPEILEYRYLLDPSEVHLESNTGIVRISNLDQVPMELDLVMNCHTLEHLADFKSVIDQIFRKIKKGGYFYLEVPLDGFKVKAFHKSRIFDAYLKLVQSNRSILILVNFLTGIWRQLFRKIPFLGIIQQSEHINYFGEESLEILLKGSGFKILAVQGPDFGFKQGKIRLGRIGVLAQRSV